MCSFTDTFQLRLKLLYISIWRTTRIYPFLPVPKTICRGKQFHEMLHRTVLYDTYDSSINTQNYHFLNAVLTSVLADNFWKQCGGFWQNNHAFSVHWVMVLVTGTLVLKNKIISNFQYFLIIDLSNSQCFLRFSIFWSHTFENILDPAIPVVNNHYTTCRTLYDQCISYPWPVPFDMQSVICGISHLWHQQQMTSEIDDRVDMGVQ